MNNIALFDMDGSLADYNFALLEELRLMQSPEETPLPESLWSVEHAPHIKARMDAIKARPGFWLGLPPIWAGFKVYDLAKEIGFQNEILTKGPKSHSLAWAEKLQWCQEYFGNDIDVHVTCNKGRVYGKVLYDDFPEYMLKWLEFRPRGLGIMPVNEFNKDFKHPQVIMYNGADDLPAIKEALEKVYNR